MDICKFADDMEAEKPRVIPEMEEIDAIEEVTQKYSALRLWRETFTWQ